MPYIQLKTSNVILNEQFCELTVGTMISKLLKTGIYHTRWMNDVLEPITLKVVLVNLQCSKQFIGTYPTTYSTNMFLDDMAIIFELKITCMFNSL